MQLLVVGYYLTVSILFFLTHSPVIIDLECFQASATVYNAVTHIFAH